VDVDGSLERLGGASDPRGCGSALRIRRQDAVRHRGLESGGARFAADFVTQVYKDRHSEAETKVLYLDYAMSFTCEALAWIADVAEEAGLRGTYGIGLCLGDDSLPADSPGDRCGPARPAPAHA
jgi:hypothetical protein